LNTTDEDTREQSGGAVLTERDSGDDGGKNDEGTRSQHFPQRGLGGDGNASFIVWLGAVVHAFWELTHAFFNHVCGGFAHRLHGHGREGIGNHGTQEETGKGPWVQDVNGFDVGADAVGTKEGETNEASLREMLAPGALVILSPIIAGGALGKNCTAGLLSGILVSGVQMAISMSNTGGAWDNAKKYIESGGLGDGHVKGSAAHKNAVTGDTVGDPLKDTSGPALNIVMKLSAIISLVFGSFIAKMSNEGGGPSWLPQAHEAFHHVHAAIHVAVTGSELHQ
jgi:inorganic pyrophosphatase